MLEVYRVRSFRVSVMGLAGDCALGAQPRQEPPSCDPVAACLCQFPRSPAPATHENCELHVFLGVVTTKHAIAIRRSTGIAEYIGMLARVVAETVGGQRAL